MSLAKHKPAISVLFVGRYMDESIELAYMNESLGQAKKSGNEVWLLGQSHHLADKHFFLENYQAYARQFDEVYVHMTSNAERFERMAFRRWFIIQEFMEKEEVDRVFLCENDVLLFANISEVLHEITGSALSIPEQLHELDWCVSGHAALWTLEDISRFCKFSLDFYQNQLHRLQKKWKWHQSTGTPGGICDMTLLYLFWKENNYIRNLNAVIGEGFFDHNISDDKNEFLGEYARDWLRIKKIRSRKGYFEAYNKKLNKWVKCHSLHFSGSAKRFLPMYLTSSKKSDLSRKAKTLIIKLSSKF